MPKIQHGSEGVQPKQQASAAMQRHEWATLVDASANIKQKELAALASYLRSSYPEVLATAVRIWQEEPPALEWLGGPHSELGGVIPALLLADADGLERVENLLAALEYGFPV